MIDLSMLAPGAPVRDHDGVLVASVQAIEDGLIRIREGPGAPPRDSRLRLTEVERTDGAGIHLKPPSMNAPSSGPLEPTS